MKIEIRKTESDDIPAVLGLMEDFARDQNLYEYFEVNQMKLSEVLFGNDRFVRSLVAVGDQTVVGYSFFYQTFSSFRGQTSVYLEDIYVSADHRGYGIGEKLLRETARVGVTFGAVRMDFQVLKRNHSAIRFYLRHRAVMDEDERHFKIVDKNFLDLVDS